MKKRTAVFWWPCSRVASARPRWARCVRGSRASYHPGRREPLVLTSKARSPSRPPGELGTFLERRRPHCARSGEPDRAGATARSSRGAARGLRPEPGCGNVQSSVRVAAPKSGQAGYAHLEFTGTRVYLARRAPRSTLCPRLLDITGLATEVTFSAHLDSSAWRPVRGVDATRTRRPFPSVVFPEPHATDEALLAASRNFLTPWPSRAQVSEEQASGAGPTTESPRSRRGF